MDPSTLPSTRRSSLPEISPFTFTFAGNHELESVLLTPAPPLGTFGALEGSTAGREGEFGGVDCDSPFRHICPPLDRAWPTASKRISSGLRVRPSGFSVDEMRQPGAAARERGFL